jgi:hypothetical protein
MELDRKFPKINHMSMLRHQYKIFKFDQSSTFKWFQFKKIPLK